jgi:hypothetical protein
MSAGLRKEYLKDLLSNSPIPSFFSIEIQTALSHLASSCKNIFKFSQDMACYGFLCISRWRTVRMRAAVLSSTKESFM